MRVWKERTVEERCLLAPSFIGSLLWAGARGAAEKGGAGLRFEYAFLLAPLVLHKRTRDRLPPNVTTSIPVWLDREPLTSLEIPERAVALVDYVREALFFGVSNEILKVVGPTLVANNERKSTFEKYQKGDYAGSRQLSQESHVRGAVVPSVW